MVGDLTISNGLAVYSRDSEGRCTGCGGSVKILLWEIIKLVVCRARVYKRLDIANLVQTRKRRL